MKNGMKMNDGCRKCQLDKKLNAYPSHATEEEIAAYQDRVKQLVFNSGEASSPEVASQISAVYREMFGPERDFTEIKRYFNELMMNQWEVMHSAVLRAEDPLKRAVQIAMTGNFIDFVALENVDENQLQVLLHNSDQLQVDAEMLEAFRKEIMCAHRLTYITDNCGEIVTDKLLLETMRKMNPALETTVMVRGLPVANDATLEDALQVAMNEAAQHVIGSGNDISGAVLERMSEQARRAAEEADLIVSKGQGNYESLSGCALNVFYIFMCKCSFFTQRFNVRQYTGILTREEHA